MYAYMMRVYDECLYVYICYICIVLHSSFVLVSLSDIAVEIEIIFVPNTNFLSLSVFNTSIHINLHQNIYMRQRAG